MSATSSRFSQPDWDHWWGHTMSLITRSKIGELGWRKMAEHGARKCLKLLEDARGIREIKSILELGGGSGHEIGIIAKKLGLKSEDLTLIDNSPEAKKVWERFSGFGNYIQGDFNTYNFNNQTFDLVFSGGLIEHLADRRKRVDLIKKHAKLSNKYVLIHVPGDNLVFRMIGMKGEEGFEKHYTPGELREEMVDAELNVVGFGKGIFLRVLAEKK